MSAVRDCGHTAIAYNSCRNRHCPKCQGRARAEWLAARQAELLPVPYFHVVFTLPAPVGADRVPEQGGGLRHPVPRRGRDAAPHRGRSQPSRRRDRRASPCCTPGARRCSTIRTSTASCRAAACRPTARAGSPAGRVLPAGPGALPALPRLFLERLAAAFARPANSRFFGDLAALADPRAFAARCAALRRIDWVVYAKPPFGGPEQVLAYLGRYTHRVAIANSRLDRHDRRRRQLPLEGLPPGRPPQGHDARAGRVHAAVPAARPARRLPSHPPLRLPRQRPSRRSSWRSADSCWPNPSPIPQGERDAADNHRVPTTRPDRPPSTCARAVAAD